MSSKYKVFNGTDWVNICENSVYVRTIINWTLLDPWDSITKYWDGVDWTEIICCTCVDGYIYDPVNRDCRKIEIIPATPVAGTTYPVVAGSTSVAYASAGTRLYEDISGKTFPLNGWQNTSIHPTSALGYQVYDNAGAGVLTTIQATSVAGNTVFTNPGTTTAGRLNAIGIKATSYPVMQWLTVEFCITIDVTKTYVFA
jgi:hypothetical protein